MKKKLLLISAILSFVFLTAPFTSVKAVTFTGILSSVFNSIIGPLFLGQGTVLISAILHTFLLLGMGLLLLMTPVLHWSMGNPFTYSFTNPATNPVINVGWTLLRDMTNLFFVLGLAYIGLATALNLGGFNTKKTFGRLIVAALLINFTPVICGAIVDATNVLMHFFTKEVLGNFNAFSYLYGFRLEAIGEAIKNTFTIVGLMKVSLALMVTYVTVGIFFFFSFLFLARNVAIWILVIMSPIAFFCWIFDSTKRHFQSWWNQFLNWSFIGVLAGFALYLSAQLLNAFKKGGLTNTTQWFSTETNVFVDLAPLIIILLFMSFAYIQVLKTSAAGSNMALKAAKFSGGKIKSQGKKIGLAAQRRVRNYGKKVAEGSSFLGGKMGTFSRIATGGATKDDKEKHPVFSKWANRLPFMGGPLGGAAIFRTIGAKLSEEESKEAEKIRKKIAGKFEAQSAALRNAISPTTKALVMSQIQEDDNTNDIPGMPQGDELRKLLETAIKTSSATVAKSLRFLDPKATKEAVDNLTKAGKATEDMLRKAGVFFDKIKDQQYGDLEGKLLAKMKADKMKYMYEDAANRYVDADGLGHKFWTGAHISKGAELFGRTFTETFVKGIKGAKNKEEHIAMYNNPRLAAWIESSASKNLGIEYGAKIPTILDTETMPDTDSRKPFTNKRKPGIGERKPGTGGRQ